MEAHTPDEQVTQALLCEYSTIRSELRDLVVAGSRHISFGLALITAIAYAAKQFKIPILVYLIPTALFVGGMYLFTQSALVSLYGTYSLKLSRKIKAHLGEDSVVFEWESGPIWQRTAYPSSLLAWGTGIIAFPFLVLFFALSIAAFEWSPWTSPIHVIELGVLIFYGWRCMRYSMASVRDALIAEPCGTAPVACDEVSSGRL